MKSDQLNKLNCAIVGLGRSGQNLHIRLISEEINYRIKGVFDCDKKLSNQISNKLDCVGYSCYEDILHDPEIQLIVIATPSKSHYELALRALSSKKNVIIEKPITRNIKQAYELKSIAIKNKVYLIPFFNFRFAYDFLIINDLLDRKYIGDIFLIKRNVSYFNRRDDWQSKLSDDGGIINAVLIHHLDQILQITKSRPIDIFGDLRRIVSQGDAPDHCKILMNFKNNIFVDIEVSWAQKSKEFPWVIYGNKGVIRQEGNNIICEYFIDNEIEKSTKSKLSYLSNENIKWRKIIKTNKEINNMGLTKYFYKELYNSIKSNKKFKVDIDSVLETMKIIDDIIIKLDRKG